MKYLISITFLVILISACLKSENNQCEYDPCAFSAPAAEVTNVENYLAANTVTATKHCSRLFYIIDATGSGTSPDICSGVSVKYKGQLTSTGVVFDEATAPVSFGLSNLIEGWKKGIMLLKPGGKIRMWIPPSLAYGSQDIKNGSGIVIIPANSILYFEVDLVAVY